MEIATNENMLANSESLSKTEDKTTLKDVSKFFKEAGNLTLRGLAGVAGGALVAGTGLGGATFVAAIALPAFIITVPAMVLGAVVGGTIGARDNSNVSTALREDFGKHAAGAILGALGGASLPIVAYVLAEGAASIPKTAFVATVGFLALVYWLLPSPAKRKNMKKSLATKTQQMRNCKRH